jgi:tetratricopeptide (TPR) repeat protein
MGITLLTCYKRVFRQDSGPYEKAVAVDDDAVETFASELSALRMLAGNPPYKQIAHRAGHHRPPVKLTPSTLSDWFRGRYAPDDGPSIKFLIDHLCQCAAAAGHSDVLPASHYERLRKAAWEQKHAARGGRPAKPRGGMGVTPSRRPTARSGAKAADSSTPLVRAARPYPLLETGEVVGRLQLRREMADFQSASKGGASIMLLVGVAGVGKSALAWDLWKRLRAMPRRQGRHLFWYSFYDGRGSGSFQGLIDELSDFLGLWESKESAHSVSSDAIIDSLSTTDTVLFLDGIERCLRCYQRPLAVGDLEIAQIQQHNMNDWGMHDLAFASDEMFRFFIQLAELPNCRVIATSRVVPSDFYASGGGLRAGVRSQVVGGLDATEALRLLNAVGLPIGDPDAATVASTFGGHPLALQLFARQASRSVSARRNVSIWLDREGYSLTAGHGPAEIRAQLFAAAAARLSLDSRMALAATGAMGGSVDLPSLQEIMPSLANDARVHQIIEEIAASGLGLATSAGLACHPITASAAADQLTRTQTEQLARTIGASLRRRFKDLDSWVDGYFRWFSTGEVSDRSEAMALCRALVRLNKWSEATKLYMDQLDRPIRLVLGANFDAIELLQQLIVGMESISEKGIEQIRTLRSRLAHHLVMAGRLKEAESILASLEEDGPLDHRAYCTASEVALHLGDSAKALRLATIAMHNARGELYFVYGISYKDWGGLELDFDMTNRGGPSADFIESATLCARVLVHEGYLPEAALLIAEGLRVRRNDHNVCDGCYGLLLRSAAELLLVSGDHSGAEAVANQGKTSQESQGKSLQGLLSEVIVMAGMSKVGSTPPSRDLLKFLTDTGFVLYELILGAVSAANADHRAIQELHQLGAKFALERIVGGEPNKISRTLSAEQLGRCVGWLIDDWAREGTGSRRQVVRPNSDDDHPYLKVRPLEGTITSKLESQIRSHYTGRMLTKVARRVQAADHNIPRTFPDLAELRVALPSFHRLQALKYAQTGNRHDYIAELIIAHNLSLYSVDTLCALTSAMVEQENFEAATEYLRILLRTTPDHSIYDFAATLVVSRGDLADRVRELLIELAEKDHESCSAYLALANLERRLGDEEAARKWHSKGLDYPPDMTARDEHRLAHVFGAQRDSFPSGPFYPMGRKKFLGLLLKDYNMVAYLLDAINHPGPVQKPDEIEGPGGSVEITEDYFRAAQEYIIRECSLLQVIGPEVVAFLKSKFQLDAG